MASKNKLLSSGSLIEEKLKVVKPDEVKDSLLETPILLHHSSKPCVVVKKRKELEALLKEGYADHPGKVRKLPGWEHLYEEPEEEEVKTEEPTKGSIFETDESVK
jgi:hypothetical protein